MTRALLVVLFAAALARSQDAYEEYINAAPEFRSVADVPGLWDTWIYMPWRYKWAVGTGDEGGRFCQKYGINGGFTDHGKGPLEWLEKYRLRFYNDHTAGKGILYLRKKQRIVQNDARAVRPVPLDTRSLNEARALVHKNLERVRLSPMRLAYALDDEISTGRFVRPTAWRVHGDDAAYEAWLHRYYGKARVARYVTPDYVRAQLDRPLEHLDFSPLLDRMTYNDSVLAEFVGKLVETANGIDPLTPCGFVGGQAPNLWGGYDYAKLCRRAQFFEVYDLGSAPEIVRSLRPNAPLVSTHFHKSSARDAWEAWSRFAHGQRGMIGWVNEKWFDGRTPRPWLEKFAPVLKELARLAPAVRGPWQHDGIAIYYSHPSIQVSWCLDAEAHGKTWPKRNDDHLRGTSHLVRKAWETMLNDAGLQYDFVAYDTVVKDGVPGRYRALILPACFALSDAEAERIREFAEAGGIVVADFMCGLFDQHGRGRKRGALDDLFGVPHDGSEGRVDFFGEKWWVETDQDRGYSAKRWSELFAKRRRAPERRLGGPYRKGNAVYLNLSPQRYLMLREEGIATARHRAAFLDPLRIEPFVQVRGEPRLEVTRLGNHLLVVQNPVLHADGELDLREGTELVTLHFARPVRLVDARTDTQLGEAREFRLRMSLTEALVLRIR